MTPFTAELIGTALLILMGDGVVANVLRYRAEIQLRAKDRDGAMRTCLNALRIARHMQKEPMIISYLVTIAVRSVGMEAANEILRAGPVAQGAPAARPR